MLDQYSIVMPGRIVEFFPATQTATVQISNDRTYSSASESQAQRKITTLPDVPIHVSGGGGMHLTFPIVAGDTLLILFSQFGYDHWLWDDKDAAGQVANNPVPHTERKFSLADGLAIVGFNTLPRAIPGYSSSNSRWIHTLGGNSIALREDGDIRLTTLTGQIRKTADNLDYNITTSWTIDCPTTQWTGDITQSGDLTVTGEVTVVDDKININTSQTPASITAPGTAGDIAWDSGYLYVCIATNSWKRAQLQTWP